MNIEVEGSELIIKNKVGDYVIIPKKYRIEVKDMIKENCHECIDALVDTLPIMEDYAEDGSLYSEYLTNDPHSKRNSLNTNPNYNLPSSFKGSFENPMQLDEVAITAKAPKWLKYRREYVKNNPFDINKYVENRFNNPVNAEEIEKINPEEWRKKLRQEGLEKRYNLAMNYVGEQLIKDKPQGKLSRVEWLNQKSDKEEEIIKRNPKYQSSLWADTKRGFISLVEQNPLQAFQNILNSKDYTNREKREILKDYIDHPIMSKLGDAAKILNPLIVPSKMIQSSYRNNYSFTDALKGKKNDAGLIEDIVTDPLNFVDIGLLGKISKADKVIDATKAGSKVLNKADNVVNKVNRYLESPDPNNYYRVIGNKEGYDDLINSGIVRPNQSGIFKGRNTYYTKGNINDKFNPVINGGVKKNTVYDGEYIVEIKPNNLHFPTDNHRLYKEWNFGLTTAGNEIPYSSEYLNVYKYNKKAKKYELLDKVSNKTN